MTEEKLKIAQDHIARYEKRIEILRKDIAREARYIQEDAEGDKSLWMIDAYTRKINDYYSEYKKYKEMKTEMQDLLNFLTEEKIEA
jgi:uncharacterized protein YfbU (UPF0304 family)